MDLLSFVSFFDLAKIKWIWYYWSWGGKMSTTAVHTIKPMQHMTKLYGPYKTGWPQCFLTHFVYRLLSKQDEWICLLCSQKHHLYLVRGYIQCQKVIAFLVSLWILSLFHAATNSSFIPAENGTLFPPMPLQPSLHDNQNLKHKAWGEVWYVSCVLIRTLSPQPSITLQLSFTNSHTHSMDTDIHTKYTHDHRLKDSDFALGFFSRTPHMMVLL